MNKQRVVENLQLIINAIKRGETLPPLAVSMLHEAQKLLEEMRVEEWKIEEMIEKSKLYQGFQCSNYVIRTGLKKRLAHKIVEELNKQGGVI